MTETETEPQTPESTPVVDEALALIDRGLVDMGHRELVSTDEVSDLLLDVRGLLAVSEISAN